MSILPKKNCLVWYSTQFQSKRNSKIHCKNSLEINASWRQSILGRTEKRTFFQEGGYYERATWVCCIFNRSDCDIDWCFWGGVRKEVLLMVIYGEHRSQTNKDVCGWFFNWLKKESNYSFVIASNRCGVPSKFHILGL